MQKKKRRLLILLILLLLFIIAAVLFFYYSEKLHLNYLDYFSGKAEILKPDNKTEPAEIKKKLFKKDRIRTYEESEAYIQLNKYQLVEIDPNSELEMTSLPDNIGLDDIETIFKLLKGKIKIFGQKLPGRAGFKINAGNYSVNVSDSIFSMEHQADILKVEVKEGNLSITPESGGAETTLAAGDKALITGNNIIKEKMIVTDYPAFENINRLRPIIDIQTATKEYIIDYFRGKPVQGNITPPKKEETDNSKITPPENKKPEIIEAEKLPAGTRLNVNALTANGVEKSEASDISKFIYSKLVSSKGKEKVIYRDVDGKSKSANRQLAGRVSKLGSTKLVFVNVTDGASGKVLFSQTASIKENDSLETVLEGLTEKIISTGEIW